MKAFHVVEMWWSAHHFLVKHNHKFQPLIDVASQVKEVIYI